MRGCETDGCVVAVGGNRGQTKMARGFRDLGTRPREPQGLRDLRTRPGDPGTVISNLSFPVGLSTPTDASKAHEVPEQPVEALQG